MSYTFASRATDEQIETVRAALEAADFVVSYRNSPKQYGALSVSVNGNTDEARSLLAGLLQDCVVNTTGIGGTVSIELPDGPAKVAA